MTADTTEASPPHDDRPLDRHQPRARHLAALSWRRGLAISFAIVFIVEALIMGAFAVLHIEFSIWTEAFIDSTVLALGAGVLAWFLVVRPLGTELTRERAVITDTQARLHTELDRRDQDARIQRAFEWASDEDGVLDVVRRSTRTILPQHHVELWMADSSRSHLRRAGFDDGTPEDGCHIASPRECVAVQQGHMLQFPSSEDLDACPRLRNIRGESDRSAVCVPVTVLGESVGVLHALGPNQTRVPIDTTTRLQTISSSAGNRLSLLRALADSQLQASVDYLTGLLNRRSLRNEASGIAASGRPYAVLMLDLDHFKRLNDSHGHDIGDRALRVFADTLSTSTTDDMVSGRWGGEEFVVLIPAAGTSSAVAAAEAVRHGLAGALRSGAVPAFTVSIGVADSTQAPTFDEVLNLADDALFRAKQIGRDRVVTADELTAPVDADLYAV
ncbi:MAG: GGDEF domain-containing protein [Dehalococcoidia bacterium]|jgi:diguanylate cyclase (GGDEF)-like protein|nr:GGDEF domain-containing protein [Dehalococcoidia bacterium]